MGQVLHGCAKTTKAVRLAIQHSQASLKSLARQYGINIKTVAKWKKRDGVEDASMGPKAPRSTVLSVEEEAICVAFRQHTLLPLDDCLYTLQNTIPKLTRSSLHRLFVRHGINRIPALENEGIQKKKFKSYSIGYFHIDIAEVKTQEGKRYLFVAIDRTSKFVYVELVDKAGKMQAAQFLRNLISLIPYKIQTVLTDNGIQFTHRTCDKYAFLPIFTRVCHEHHIEHRLTQVNHPWTNGQVERMNRTLKEATVNKYYYKSHQALTEHLNTFVNAYNFAKRLKALKGLTPYEFILKMWQIYPEKFTINPNQHNMGPYILGTRNIV